MDPIARYLTLYADAQQSEPFDPSRAALATVDALGAPSVRYVLVKTADAEGFYFFTSYTSRKGQELDATGVAALAFHWHSLGVQVRVEGTVARVSPARSDAYFASRPRGHQIGAWASHQSEPITGREEIEARAREIEARFEGQAVPRPPTWGGYVLSARAVEFWRDRPDRLHDRERYELERGGYRVTKLSP